MDNTAPAVYITFGETSDEITIPAYSSSGKELGFTVNAIDNVGVTVGPTCSDAGASLGVTPNAEAGYFTIDSKMYQIGMSIVVCTASDAAGNMGSSTFAVTIQPEVADTTPPTINIPSDLVNGITLTASDSSGAVIGGSAMGNIMSISASDNVGIPYFGWADVTDLDIKNTRDGFYFSDWGTIRTNNLENASTNVWCNNKSMWDGGKFPIGTTTITCKAYASNNGVESSFTITVVDSSSADTPPPVINLPENYQVSPSSDWDGSSAESIVTQTFVIHVDDDRDYPFDNPNTIDCTYGSGMTAD